MSDVCKCTLRGELPTSRPRGGRGRGGGGGRGRRGRAAGDEADAVEPASALDEDAQDNDDDIHIDAVLESAAGADAVDMPEDGEELDGAASAWWDMLEDHREVAAASAFAKEAARKPGRASKVVEKLVTSDSTADVLRPGHADELDPILELVDFPDEAATELLMHESEGLDHEIAHDTVIAVETFWHHSSHLFDNVPTFASSQPLTPLRH